MPPPNDRRRALIADTAIELLVESGVHGVTHRAIDSRAGLPAGTASNYFRSREALLVAVTQRVAELHRADMSEAADVHIAAGSPREQAVALIAGSLLAAATVHRTRYLAIFELQLESLRRPALTDALQDLAATIAEHTAQHHRQLRLDIPPPAVPLLMTLYGGALFTLVSAPPGTVTAEVAHGLAASIVRGALG